MNLLDRIRTRWPLAIGWTGAAVGALFVLVAIACGIYNAMYLRDSLRTQGTITAEMERRTEADASTGTEAMTVYCPQFEYAFRDGQVHSRIGTACSNPPSFTVGQQVPVRYLASDPDGGRIESTGEFWGFTIGFGIAGVVLAAIGIPLLGWWRRKGGTLDPLSFWD